MNKTTIRIAIRVTAAVFLAAVLIPAFVTAQEAQAPPPAGKKPPVKMGPRESLGLTAEQEKALEELRKARRDESRAFRDEMQTMRGEMRELAKDTKANQAKIDALIDKTAELRAGREKAAFRNRAERDKIFTPEQLEKMKAVRERLVGRAGLAGPGRMGIGRMGRFRPLRHRLLLWRRW